MSTKTDVCNHALALCGQAPQQSFDPSVKHVSVRRCNEYWERARRKAMSKYRWRNLITQVALAESPTAPLFGYTKSYLLPADCLRPLNLQYKDQQWSRRGSVIHTNYAGAKLEYIRDTQNLGELDEYTLDVMGYTLADYIVVPLLGPEKGRKLARELRKELREDVLPEARKINAIQRLESDHLKVNQTSWQRARRNRYSSNRIAGPQVL